MARPDRFTSTGELTKYNYEDDIVFDHNIQQLTPPEHYQSAIPSFSNLFSIPIDFITKYVRDKNEARLLLHISRLGQQMDVVVKLYIVELQQAELLDRATTSINFSSQPFLTSITPTLAQAAAQHLHNLAVLSQGLAAVATLLARAAEAVDQYRAAHQTVANELCVLEEIEGLKGLASVKSAVAKAESLLAQRLDLALHSTTPHRSVWPEGTKDWFDLTRGVNTAVSSLQSVKHEPVHDNDHMEDGEDNEDEDNEDEAHEVSQKRSAESDESSAENGASQNGSNEAGSEREDSASDDHIEPSVPQEDHEGMGLSTQMPSKQKTSTPNNRAALSSSDDKASPVTRVMLESTQRRVRWSSAESSPSSLRVEKEESPSPYSPLHGSPRSSPHSPSRLARANPAGSRRDTSQDISDQ